MLKRLRLVFVLGTLASAATGEEGPTPASGARVRLTGATGFAIPGQILSDAERADGRSSDPYRDLLTYRGRAGELLRAPLPGERLVGTLVSFDDDTFVLSLRKGTEPIRVPRAAVAKLEVSRHPDGRPWGALIGFAVGFVPLAVAPPRPPGSDRPIEGRDRLELAGIAGLLGATVGSLVGPGEGWQNVRLSVRQSVGVRFRPSRDGGAFTVAFGF
jgi:hypothetical protein